MKSVINEVAEAIKIEANEIHNYVEYFDREVFNRALNLLYSVKGRIIITGVGKSGHIANKMAATFSSTGSPSFFLHPTEALHGDLGIVSEDDVIIVLSRSGESEELNLIIPFLKKRNIKIVTVTSNPNSTLSGYADINLLYHISREACPNNLAPTTSTTLTLAIGDGLAIGLMLMKNFKEEDFAQHHPGGRLGRRLTLTARDILIGKKDLVVLNAAECNMEEILNALTSSGLGIVLFSNSLGLFEGIITDGDIRRLLKEHRDEFFSLDVERFINYEPVKIAGSLKAIDVLKIMEERDKPLNVVPVINDSNQIEGIIRLHELYKLLN